MINKWYKTVQDSSQPSHTARMPLAARVASCEADVLMRGVWARRGGGSSCCARGGSWAVPWPDGGRARRSLDHLGHCGAPGPDFTKRVTWMAGQTQTVLTRAVTCSCRNIRADWIPRRLNLWTRVVFVLFLGAAGDVPKFLARGL